MSRVKRGTTVTIGDTEILVSGYLYDDNTFEALTTTINGTDVWDMLAHLRVAGEACGSALDRVQHQAEALLIEERVRGLL